jgi:murein L,D-transpeptidase YafK
MAHLQARLSSDPDDYEASLLKGLLYFKSGKLHSALTELNSLTHRAPKFYLAYLIQGDLLLAQTHTVTDIGRSPVLAGLKSKVDSEHLQQLRQEAQVRLRAYLNSLQHRLLPRQLLALGPTVKMALVVDKHTHRLFVYRRRGDGKPPQLVRDFYVSTGKLAGNKQSSGDLRTPEGVYFVTRHIPGSQLPDMYGIGAFPVNYPNALDRHEGKTGSGIWLHGTANDYYSRPPQDSEGCVVLTNVDLKRVGRYITPGSTPVVITDSIDWVGHESWEKERQAALQALEQWRQDWDSGDVDKYLSHYAPDFWSKGYDYKRWVAHKRQVAQGKRTQQVQLSDVSLFAYPRDASGDRRIVVADFDQHYRSNNFNSDIRKRLYLAQEHGQWKVIYEGTQ